QLVERVLGKDEVMGSSPITSSGLGSDLRSGTEAVGRSSLNVYFAWFQTSQLFWQGVIRNGQRRI
ncbi:MAG: hypothetical protein ACK48X_09410, partial [Planctomycetota bacterium]